LSTIDIVLKEGYNYAVSLNMQQKGSKLSSCVREEEQTTERYYYDQIAPTEAVDVVNRHSDTPLVKTNYDRRMVALVSSD
jgi:hypothetical protein